MSAQECSNDVGSQTRRRMKRTAVALASLCLAVPLLVVTATGAAAATTCDDGSLVEYPGDRDLALEIPRAYTASGNPIRTCILRVARNESDAVRALQVSLRECEDISLAVDGFFGQDTKDAVKRVQRRYDLAADGIYGPQTAKKMKWQAFVAPWAGPGEGTPGNPRGCRRAPSLWN